MTHSNVTTIRLCGPGHGDIGRIVNGIFTVELPGLRAIMRGMAKAQVHTLHCLAPMPPMLDMLAEFTNLRNIQLCIAGNEVVRHFDFSLLRRLKGASIIAMSPITVNFGESMQRFNCTPNVTIVGYIHERVVGNFRQQEDSSDDSDSSVDSDDSTDTVQVELPRPRTPHFGIIPKNLLPNFNAC